MQRAVHDRAAGCFARQSRAATRCSRSSIRWISASSPAASSRSPGRPAAASRRCWPDRRARLAVDRPHPDRRRRHHRDVGRRARAVSRHADRLRLSVLPPAAVADRVGERARAAGDRRRAGCRRPRATRCSPRSACGRGAITIRRSSPAASSSASRSRARWPTIRRSCSPTSRPGNLDSATGHQVIDLLIDVNRRRKTTVVLVTHDPELAQLRRCDDRPARRPGRQSRATEPHAFIMTFVLLMAGREIRASWRRLLFFFVCVAIGVGAIVALRSMIQNMRNAAVARVARADRRRRRRSATNRPWTPELRGAISTSGSRPRRSSARQETVEVATMVRPRGRHRARRSRGWSSSAACSRAFRSTAHRARRTAHRSRTTLLAESRRAGAARAPGAARPAVGRSADRRRRAVHDSRRDLAGAGTPRRRVQLRLARAGRLRRSDATRACSRSAAARTTRSSSR